MRLAPDADRWATALRVPPCGSRRCDRGRGTDRGSEVLPLLLTLSSGVKGFTTLHAGSARQALSRLRFIAQLADVSNELPMSALNSLISEAIDLVVHCVRTPNGLRVSEIIAVEEQQTGRDATAFTTTELFRRSSADGDLQWSGTVPIRVTRILEDAGIDTLGLLHAVPQRATMSERPSPAERSR